MKIKKIALLIIIIIILIFSFSASVFAESALIAFKDLRESDWFYNDLEKLYKLGIINGKPQKDGTVIFDPKGLVTKAEFTKMLVEAMGYDYVDGNTFKDVGYDRHWAKIYIEIAVNEGVINPADEGDKFWSDIPIKRNDMAYMMFKALKLEPSNKKTPFPDIDAPYATRLHEEYLIKGALSSGGKIYFNADGLTTRAEAATIIARLIEYRENPNKYKEKMIAEEKANEFIEPKFRVKKAVSKTNLMEVYIVNYEDYDEDYEFLVECINYPQINKYWASGYTESVYVDRLKNWYDYSVLTHSSAYKDKGWISSIHSTTYYEDKALTKGFKAKTGMVFNLKISIKKGDKIKNYTVPVEILEK